ncbi:DUF3037 domain-containing protein [Nocardioides bruguierae]|uniref:DUF3037 domain-containing protein n=1 Tax=Nocardioides bruguierae TaxID=2945102 RepID=A0A9X2D667_9ACTN|nr:DUF3037 domain-containing protein [Nocardioides bruguierae]MCL8027330.1 DUF3037 domain-containing protein [Nocardioides bruguierae]MCM0619577.1 DUF3037 domain-containing protein [Nocardioides bruguierae]
MTQRVSYQYVVLRCVPRPEREEFCNVGVVLYCHATDFLGVAHRVDEARLSALAPGLDLAHVHRGLAYAEAVASGSPAAGAASGERTSQRFGFLKAPRSTVLQPGPVHGGVCEDPAAALGRLLDAYVD